MSTKPPPRRARVILWPPSARTRRTPSREEWRAFARFKDALLWEGLSAHEFEQRVREYLKEHNL